MKRSHGSYSKNSRHLRGKGRRSATRLLQSFSDGERVRIEASSGRKEGRPFLRFNRLAGTVVGRQGSAYLVRVRDGRREKTLIVSNYHLVPLAKPA